MKPPSTMGHESVSKEAEFEPPGLAKIFFSDIQSITLNYHTPSHIFSFGFGYFFGINLANKASTALCDALTIFVHPFIVDSLALNVYTA